MRLFSVSQARAALPDVEKVLRKVMRVRDKIEDLLEAEEPMVEYSNDEGFHAFVTQNVKVNKEFHRLYFQFYASLERLHKMGVQLRDIDDGIVDFPSRLQGRKGFLCWQVGEGEMLSWHDEDVDVEERVPILDLDEYLKKKSL